MILHGVKINRDFDYGHFAQTQKDNFSS